MHVPHRRHEVARLSLVELPEQVSQDIGPRPFVAEPAIISSGFETTKKQAHKALQDAVPTEWRR